MSIFVVMTETLRYLKIGIYISSACESSFWLGKTWAQDDHLIPIRYLDWPCNEHGCSDSVVVITSNR